GPFVETRGQSEAAEVSSGQLGVVGRSPPCGVGVRGLHVADGGGQVGGGGNRVVGGVDLPGHRARGGEYVRGVGHQREAGDEARSGGTQSQVTGHLGTGHVGDSGFREDHVAARRSHGSCGPEGDRRRAGPRRIRRVVVVATRAAPAGGQEDEQEESLRSVKSSHLPSPSLWLSSSSPWSSSSSPSWPLHESRPAELLWSWMF